MATMSAMGATPVSMVSTAIFCARPLAKRRKSEASRPSIERPLRSVTLTGTTTKRDLTSNRESWARRQAARAQTMSARVIPVSGMQSKDQHAERRPALRARPPICYLNKELLHGNHRSIALLAIHHHDQRI